MGSTAILAIKIISDASAAGKGIDGATTKVSKLSKAGQVSGRILAAGLAAAGVAAVKFTKAAADDQAAASKLAGVLHNAAGASDAQVAATERWITAQGKAKGVSDDELRPALTRLVAATHSVTKARRLAALGENISAATGKSLESVTSALAKAQTGSLGGLSRLGVATKNAAGQTRSLHSITKELAKTYGGAAAKQAQTAAGKQKILSVQLGELQEKIGAKLLPVMLKLSDVGLKVVDWIDRNTTTALALVGVLGSVLAIVKLVSVATQVWSAGLKIAGAVSKAYTGVQWLLNAAMAANPITLVVIAIVALVAVIVIAWKRSETFRRIVLGAWAAIKKATAATWGAIKHAISAVWDWLVSLFRRFTIVGFIISHWDKIKAATVAVWNAIRSAIGRAWDAVTRTVTGALSKVRNLLVNSWNAVRGLFVRAWDGYVGIVRGAIGRVVDFVSGLRTRILTVLRNAGTWLWDAGRRIIQGLIDGITAMFRKLKDKLSVVTRLIPDWKGPRSKDAQLLRPAGETIMDGLITGIERRHARLRASLAAVSGIIAGGVNPDPFSTLRGSSPSLATAAGGATIFHVTINGATDPDGTARVFEKMIDRRSRRIGRRG